jgi:hypothetical protein
MASPEQPAHDAPIPVENVFHQEAPQVVEERVPYGDFKRYPNQDYPGKPAFDGEEPKPGTRTILGLPPKTFWIILAVVLVLVAAAIGGGVGGYFAGKNRSTPSGDSDG